MEIHNYMEDVVMSVVENTLSKAEDICNCQKCKLDIAALALNKLPPKYIVTQKGRVYTKLAELQLQAMADVTREVTKAIEIVKKNPHH